MHCVMTLHCYKVDVLTHKVITSLVEDAYQLVLDEDCETQDTALMHAVEGKRPTVAQRAGL